jgi:hypothetical protein
MGKTCIGCGKAMGGVIGAYGVKLLYGEVCLTCNKKLNSIPNYQFLTPTQIKDVITGKVKKEDVRISCDFSRPGDAVAKPPSPAEEIRQYKELLDDGIITREEFEAVKKRLMNI